MPALSNLQLPPTDSSSQALATSDSFSLLSEPLDIRNWFASYVYDSPELNTLDGLQDLDGSEETCIEGVNGEKFEKLRKKGGFEEAPLAEMESSNGIVNSIETDESDRKFAALDILDIEPTKTLSIQNQLTLKRIGKHKLPGETGCNNHGSVINSRAASMYDRGDNTKLEHSLLDITNCNSLFQEKSIRRNITKSSQQKENLSDATSGTLGLTAVKEDSWKGPFETAKENDGFVSTRKKGRQSNSVNLMPKDGLQCVTNFEKGANRSGKVLFDKSDFHYSNVHGETGKWECPQRNKPNFGPPLKQLRLEHWVRRG